MAIVEHVADEVLVQGEVDLGRVMTGAEALPGGLGQRLGETMQLRDVGEHRVVTGIGPDADDGTGLDEVSAQRLALQRDPLGEERVAEGDPGDRLRDPSLAHREEGHGTSLLQSRPMYLQGMQVILQGMSSIAITRPASRLHGVGRCH